MGWGKGNERGCKSSLIEGKKNERRVRQREREREREIERERKRERDREIRDVETRCKRYRKKGCV